MADPINARPDRYRVRDNGARLEKQPRIFEISLCLYMVAVTAAVVIYILWSN